MQYLYEHPPSRDDGVFTFLLTVGLLDICMISWIKIMIAISDFLQNLNRTTISLNSRAFVFILLQKFYNYMQFNLLVTILHYMTLYT